MANLNAGAGAAEGFSFDTITANVAKSKVDDECVSAASSIDYISIPQASQLHTHARIVYTATACMAKCFFNLS